MVVAGAGSIYRFTNTGDTEDSILSSEVVEFNGGNKPDVTGKHIATGFRSTRDLSFHPNPRRAGTKIQDNLLGIKLITVTGYFTDHDATQGPASLDTWQNEPAFTTDFPFGRFGLRLPDFAAGLLTLVPTATKGYILYDIDVQDVESPRDEVQFIAWLYRHGDAT